jgi:hypothetical protein
MIHVTDSLQWSKGQKLWPELTMFTVWTVYASLFDKFPSLPVPLPFACDGPRTQRFAPTTTNLRVFDVVS